MRRFEQRLPRPFFWAISVFFLLLTFSGIYGFFYSPQDEIRIYHIFIVMLMSIICLLYVRSDVVLEIDCTSKQIRVWENGNKLLDAEIVGGIMKQNIYSSKLVISKYKMENLSIKYRWSIIIPKSNEIIFSNIFLKEISK